MSEEPLVYLIYGSPGSERRSILFDLIEGGVSKEDKVLYFQPTGEAPSPFDDRIDSLENVSTVPWQLDRCTVKHGRISAAPDKIFFLAPGTADPADVAEALQGWISHNRCALARIITVIDCSFLKSCEKARGWYDACIHFSDIVLLSRREGVENRWLRDFEIQHRKKCYPCHLELTKKGKAANPVAVLEPEARRISLYFDQLIPIEEDSLDEEERPEDIRPDRYIERNEAGQRIQGIPDISRFLQLGSDRPGADKK